ncbi:MAG TPA: OmpA family protein [Opitutaceae bacterium]|jgi:peptidoglycan-associated lipoprotein
MKLASKPLLVIASAALLLAGCRKKPVRPDPSATAMGPQAGGGGALAPTSVDVAPDTSLQQRDPNVIEDANTIRGLLQPVYFAFDRDAISAAERPKLQAAKDYLDKNPQYRILLEGHCDWRGTSEYNLGLGDHRANSAKKYLISIGVSPDKIETLSKGSEESKKNADDATMTKDRRDDLVILKKT